MSQQSERNIFTDVVSFCGAAFLFYENLFYYKSCKCGAVGTETFEYGDMLAHTCDQTVAEDTYLKDEATCTSKAVYYKSCKCGAVGTETFEYGDMLAHTYGEWIDEIKVTCEEDGEKGHYHCSGCGKNFDENKEEITDLTIETTGHIYKNDKCESCGADRISEGLAYKGVTDTGYIVTGIGTCKDTDIIIPSTYNGLPVIGVESEAFRRVGEITSVKIPDSVTSIGDNAFEGCSSLTSVTIGDGVTSIGESAFDYCSSLTSVTVGDGVTSIGDNAFYQCSSLTSVTIGANVNSIGDYTFYNCTKLTTIGYNATGCADFAYTNYVFYAAGTDGDGITVTIGKNVKKLPAYLFYRNSYNGEDAPKIARVVFEEESVCEGIGDYAFRQCSSLTSIEIPDSVTSIGSYAFYQCSSLTSIEIPDNVTAIGNCAFYQCTSLTCITIGSSAEIYNLHPTNNYGVLC